jgi:hypothetical protein
VAEDNPAPPLPQRVPGSNGHVPRDNKGPGAGPAGPVKLPEDVLRHIRHALDSMRDEASPQDHTVRTERPAALPRRVPGASNGPTPPAVVARPRLPSPPRSRIDEAPTDEFPAISASRPGSGTEEITAQPEPATAVPADPQPIPGPLPATEKQAHRQDRPDEATGHLEKAPTSQQSRRTSQRKAPACRTKRPNRASKPPSAPVPSYSPQPVPQMALVFPLEPPGAVATPIRPAPIGRQQRARLVRSIGCAIMALARHLRVTTFGADPPQTRRRAVPRPGPALRRQSATAPPSGSSLTSAASTKSRR